MQISIDRVKVSKDDNSRLRDFTEEESFKALVKSIRNIGLVQPVAVVKRKDGDYDLRAGFRRYEACKQLGHAVIEVNVVEPPANSGGVITAAENSARDDLHWVEACREVLKLEQTGMTGRAIASAIGKSPSSVSHMLRVAHCSVFDLIVKDYLGGCYDPPNAPTFSDIRDGVVGAADEAAEYAALWREPDPPSGEEGDSGDSGGEKKKAGKMRGFARVSELDAAVKALEPSEQKKAWKEILDWILMRRETLPKPIKLEARKPGRKAAKKEE